MDFEITPLLQYGNAPFVFGGSAGPNRWASGKPFDVAGHTVSKPNNVNPSSGEEHALGAAFGTKQHPSRGWRTSWIMPPLWYPWSGFDRTNGS